MGGLPPEKIQLLGISNANYPSNEQSQEIEMVQKQKKTNKHIKKEKQEKLNEKSNSLTRS